MQLGFQTLTERIRQLDVAVAELEQVASTVGLPPPNDFPWFDLLHRKLVPQLQLAERIPHLVVALVGGTNIGKSLLFNHLAGEVASGVSPLAAGTKHPVCLVPPQLADQPTLAKLFEGFELAPWQHANAPLHEYPQNVLFWRVGTRLPEWLLLLDTPDVDSDVPVNWQRASAVRQVADVLIAVLTQQKYNDAAVKQFFREAAAADKPVIVLFNQTDLQRDRQYWPLWLETFTGQSGAKPLDVYVVPHDRQAAEQLQLPIYCVGNDAQQWTGRPVDFAEHLGQLHYDPIKVQALRGALGRILDPRHGLPGYLDAIRNESERFAGACKVLSGSEIRAVDWPALPAQLIATEVTTWWDGQRSTWSRGIHQVYRTLGKQARRLLSAAWQATGRQRPTDPIEEFQRREKRAILQAVERMLDQLENLAQLGNEILQPRLSRALSGRTRQELLQRIESDYGELAPVDQSYREFLHAELDRWKSDNPRTLSLLRRLDQVAALARPAVSVALVLTGWGLAGPMIGSSGHLAGEFALEALVTCAFAGSGELAIRLGGEQTAKALVKLLQSLQTEFVRRRAQWLDHLLRQQLLGDLLDELSQGAQAPEREPFRSAERLVAELRQASQLG